MIKKLENFIYDNKIKNIIYNFINNYNEDLETIDDHGITDSYFNYMNHIDNLRNNNLRNNNLRNNNMLTNSHFDDNDW